MDNRDLDSLVDVAWMPPASRLWRVVGTGFPRNPDPAAGTDIATALHAPADKSSLPLLLWNSSRAPSSLWAAFGTGIVLLVTGDLQRVLSGPVPLAEPVHNRFDGRSQFALVGVWLQFDSDDVVRFRRFRRLMVHLERGQHVGWIASDASKTGLGCSGLADRSSETRVQFPGYVPTIDETWEIPFFAPVPGEPSTEGTSCKSTVDLGHNPPR